jgi:hypothetical protein
MIGQCESSRVCTRVGIRQSGSVDFVVIANKGIDPTSQVLGYHGSQRARVMPNTLARALVDPGGA